MDTGNLRHKMTFGNSKKIWQIITLITVPAAAIITALYATLARSDKYLGVIFFVCIIAITSLILMIVFSINYNKYGAFYAMDVIDNKIVVVSEKYGETFILPEEIEKITFVQPMHRRSNINCSFYAKLKSGKKVGASYTISEYSELEGKMLLFKDENDIPFSFMEIPDYSGAKH
ncbi:MAG TPA: hypothetical protein VHT34_09900 [Clostridia bacterium]|nr:hypothetical protein [Clostridia bacterium]